MPKPKFDLEHAIEEFDAKVEVIARLRELDPGSHELTDQEKFILYVHSKMFEIDERYRRWYELLYATYNNVQSRSRYDHTEFEAFTSASVALHELFYQQP